MKDFIYITSGLTRRIPLRLFMKLTGQNVIFPFYHLVSDSDVVHIKHLYHIRNAKQFESDLDFFITEYGITDMRYLLEEAISGNKTNKKGFVISFDDGLREVYDIAAPLLWKKGIQAIFFINSGFIDNADLFFRYKASILIEHLTNKPLSVHARTAIEKWARCNKMRYDNNGKFLLSIDYKRRNLLDDLGIMLDIDFSDYLKLQQPYLTSAQIKSLSDKGFIIGAHSIDHPLLAELSSGEQKYQVSQSIDIICDKFQAPFRFFSFPFTDDGLSESFINELLDGPNRVADLTFGCAGIKHDVHARNIQRIPMEYGIYKERQIIYGEYLYYMVKAVFNRNTIRRA